MKKTLISKYTYNLYIYIYIYRLAACGCGCGAWAEMSLVVKGVRVAWTLGGLAKQRGFPLPAALGWLADSGPS